MNTCMDEASTSVRPKEDDCDVSLGVLVLPPMSWTKFCKFSGDTYDLRLTTVAKNSAADSF